jgi:thymidylate synthase (FAD)
MKEVMPLVAGYTIPVLDHGFVRYIDHMGTDLRVLEAARISYRSPSKGEEADKKLLHYLFKNKHTSPFEMCKITFNIKMPIFVMRQFVRHRMQNLNEVSARYTELPGEFYVPKVWRMQDLKNKQGSSGSVNPVIESRNMGGLQTNFHADSCLRSFCEDAYSLYQKLLEAGIAKEMARFCLPVNIYTEIYCCWDLKNLLGFFSLRDDAHAQWEHQQYGKAMKQIAAELFPWTLEAYERFKFPAIDLAECPGERGV